MKRLLMIGIVLLAVCGIASAQDKPIGDCPKISVVGPPGISNPGSIVRFKVEPELKEFNDLRFEWKISDGKLIDGHGTSQIAVKSDENAAHTAIIAKVVVTGLPTGCTNSAEETAFVVANIHPILIDEFGNIPSNDQKGRLDNALHELEQHPAHKGYVILRYKYGTSQAALLKRVKLINNHTLFRKFPRNRIVIMSEAGNNTLTKIYRLPPDFGNMICDTCKIHH